MYVMPYNQAKQDMHTSENKSVAWKILLLYIHGTDWSKSKDR